jgi:hypothetical protein
LLLLLLRKLQSFVFAVKGFAAAKVSLIYCGERAAVADVSLVWRVGGGDTRILCRAICDANVKLHVPLMRLAYHAIARKSETNARTFVSTF